MLAMRTVENGPRRVNGKNGGPGRSPAPSLAQFASRTYAGEVGRTRRSARHRFNARRCSFGLRPTHAARPISPDGAHRPSARRRRGLDGRRLGGACPRRAAPPGRLHQAARSWLAEEAPVRQGHGDQVAGGARVGGHRRLSLPRSTDRRKFFRLSVGGASLGRRASMPPLITLMLLACAPIVVGYLAWRYQLSQRRHHP